MWRLEVETKKKVVSRCRRRLYRPAFVGDDSDGGVGLRWWRREVAGVGDT
jgi:hypothetical protein